MRLLPWNIAVLALGCGTPPPEDMPVDPALVPPDWRADPVVPPPDPEDVLQRITIETASGPLTFPVVDHTGTPMILEHAAGFDNGPGPDVLYGSDGDARWRLDHETLRFVDRQPWHDEAGVPHRPDTLTAGWYAGIPVLLTSHGSDLRSWDDDRAALSAPIPLAATNRDAPVSIFSPTALTLLHQDPSAGLLIGLDADGGLHAELQPLTMTPFLVPPTLCEDGRPFAPSILVTATEAAPVGPFAQAVFAVSGTLRFRQLELRCFSAPEVLVDDDEQPIAPTFGASFDVDDDGIDELVWGHP